jgi:hypothetical protein
MDETVKDAKKTLGDRRKIGKRNGPKKAAKGGRKAGGAKKGASKKPAPAK